MPCGVAANTAKIIGWEMYSEMGFLQEIEGFLHGNDELEGEEFLEDDQEFDSEEWGANEHKDAYKSHGGRTVNIQATTRLQMVMCRPKTIEQAATAAEAIARGRSVVLNMESTAKDDLRRVIDFLSGAAFASGSTLRKISAGSYLILPKDIQLDESDMQMLEGWQNSSFI